MGFIENVLESFSAKDLKSRVNYVIAGGLAVCVITAVALYFLLTSVQRISVQGTARWEEGQEGALAVSIDALDLPKFTGILNVGAELLDPGKGISSFECEILTLEPSPPIVRLNCPGLPPELRSIPRMDASIVLYEEPLLQMLWGSGRR